MMMNWQNMTKMSLLRKQRNRRRQLANLQEAEVDLVFPKNGRG